MAKEDGNVGSCALCKQTAELKNSHLVPDFFLGSLGSVITEGTRKGQRETSVMHFGDNPNSKEFQQGAYERQHGFKMRLLCGGCEEKLSRWETYARRVLYGNDPGPDIRKRELGRSIATRQQFPNVKWFRDLREVKVKYKEFKLFELSLIWRAAVAKKGLEVAYQDAPPVWKAALAKKGWGREVKLGPYEENLREHLLSEDPGGKLYLPATLIDLRNQEIAFEGIASSVELLNKNPCHLYRMQLGGYDWTFSVGKPVPSDFSRFCLQENGNLMVIVVDGRPRAIRFNELIRTLPSNL